MTRELSGSAVALSVNYAAYMDADGKRFTVHAQGMNRTSGFRTFLQVDPRLILPAQADFVNIPPSGVVLEVLTPFHVTLTMVAAAVMGEQQRTIIVHDSQGSHTVTIADTPRGNT